MYIFNQLSNRRLFGVGVGLNNVAFVRYPRSSITYVTVHTPFPDCLTPNSSIHLFTPSLRYLCHFIRFYDTVHEVSEDAGSVYDTPLVTQVVIKGTLYLIYILIAVYFQFQDATEAGLPHSTTSTSILKDSSPPVIPAVYEVADDTAGVDVDYQAFDTGLVRHNEELPVKTIVGACVGGGLFLIILLCASGVVLYKRKTSNRNHQQQTLQSQPQQEQEGQMDINASDINATEHEYTYIDDVNVTGHEYTYIDDGALNSRNTSTPLVDNGGYVHISPVGGIPMSQMSDTGDYLNANMAPKERNVTTT